MSWQQNPNNDPLRHRQMSEEGEIGEEEGEIVNTDNTMVESNPPPPLLPNQLNRPHIPSNTAPAPLPQRGLPPPSQQQQLPPQQQMQQQQPQPRRNTWGPRPGRGAPFNRAVGRGLGNRHNSFSNAAPIPPPGPVRSQSLSATFSNRPGRGPPPAGRPTDPRFRGNDPRAAAAAAAVAAVAAFPDRRPSTDLTINTPMGGNIPPNPHGAGPPPVAQPPPLVASVSSGPPFNLDRPPRIPPHERLPPQERMSSYSSLADTPSEDAQSQDGSNSFTGGGVRNFTRPDGPPPPSDVFRKLADGSSSFDTNNFQQQQRPLRGNNNEMAETGNFPPRAPLQRDVSAPPFRDAELETGIPQSSGSFPPSLRGFRGGGPPGHRRGRGGEPPFRGGGGNYYGPEYRRSPSTRGRPIFRGNLNRQGSWRNNDPRFGGEPQTQPQHPSQQQLQQQQQVQEDGPGFRRQIQTDVHPETDTFAKMVDWPSRQSPHSSPQKVNSQFGVSPPTRANLFVGGVPPMAPNLDDAKPSEISSANVEKSEHATVTELTSEDKPKLENTIAPPPLPNPAPTPPKRLSTTSLEDSDRAKKALAALADYFEVVQGDQLPTKNMIMTAMIKMDAQIKTVQDELDLKQKEIEEALEAERLEQQRQKERAIAEAARRQEEAERLRQELDKHEEMMYENDVKDSMQKEEDAFERARKEAMKALEQEIEKAKTIEQETREFEMQKQIEAATKSFEAALAQARAEVSAAEDSTVMKAPPVRDVVQSILAANKRRAQEAHLLQTAAIPSENEQMHTKLAELKDPKEQFTFEEWASRTKNVTGLADALYSEPCEAPFYDLNEQTHRVIAPVVKEYVRDKQTRLRAYWLSLAEEYECRRNIYREKRALEARNCAPVPRRVIIPRQVFTTVTESGQARQSSNPYRRARRGNEVRTEYEQEQIIAEIAAKETMEKRIVFGKCEVPRQVCDFEKELTATFVNTFNAQMVDMIEQEADLAIANPWSDMEKCIFLDRFLQHPKDFRKIASFLRNKSTIDCVQFYYDSKQTVPYKEALKEHIMRRKRRTDVQSWEATIQAAISCGAVVEAGPNEEKPLIFLLPEDEHSFSTYSLHPIRREILDSMYIDEGKAVAYELENEEQTDEDITAESSKRKADPLFVLDSEQRKYLRVEEPEVIEKKKSAVPLAAEDESELASSSVHEDSIEENTGSTPTRKAPQKWTASEKAIFHETLEKHGRNWDLLAQAIATKSKSQIKNYYYDNNKKSGKGVVKSESEGKPTSRVKTEKKYGRLEKQKSRSGGDDSQSVTPVPEDTMSVESAREESEQCEKLQRDSQPPIPSSEQEVIGEIPPLNMEPTPPASEHSFHQLPVPNDTTVAELWAAQQQQAALRQHQTHITDDIARQLLQHHSHTQHQQLISSVLPWMAASQVQQVPAQNTIQDWAAEVQQYQNLLQMQQQQEQQRRQAHHNPLAALGAGNAHLQSLALASLAGIGGSGTLAGGLGIDQDELRIALAQQLLGIGADTNPIEALNLLARSVLARRSNKPSSFHGSNSSDGGMG